MDYNTYIRSRTPFSPEPGKIYENEGGGRFLCEGRWHLARGAHWMINIVSGWRFLAHGCGIYADGRIDWDYSTDGRFETPPEIDARGAKV